MSLSRVQHYNFNEGNNGIAVIFNHQNFDCKDERTGTDVDGNRLVKILKAFGYNIRYYMDLRRREIDDVLEKLSKENHEENSSIIVFVLTHGSQNKLWARDKNYATDEIFQHFYGDRCGGLVNKPKLFFIQACRGVNRDPGASITHDFCEEVSYKIPITADFFVMYSTFEGCVSVRNPRNGTWFIQTICDVLEKVENGIELTELATRVSYKIAKDCWSENQCTKQMPVTCSTLRKMCYLKRFYNENNEL